VDGSITDATMVFDPITGNWASGPSMLLGVSNACSAMHSGHMFIIGGSTDNGPTDKVQILDLNTHQWSFGQDMPTARFGHGCAVAGDEIFAVGTAGTILMVTPEQQVVVQAYNVKTNTWRWVEPLPGHPRSNEGVAAHDGQIHVFAGGSDDEGETADHWILDVSSETWSAGPPVPRTGEMIVATTVGDQIYCIAAAVVILD